MKEKTISPTIVILTVLLISAAAGAVMLIMRRGLETEPPRKILPPELPVSAAAEGGPEAAILAMLDEMTDDEKIGQLFIAHAPASKASEFISKYKPAGLVMFADDFSGRNTEQAKANIAGFQASSSIPLFIMADEEGGRVVRVSRYKAFAEEPFAAPAEVYARGGTAALAEDARAKAALLLSLGVNTNLAPVCDVSTNPQDYIYSRTLGLGPRETAEGIAAVVAAMRQEGLLSTLKHFPGYGGAKDTHKGMAVDSRPRLEYTEGDFLPFAAGIGAGADFVMVSHVIAEAFDKAAPASLSKPVHDVLRDELGFKGVIITDDLGMEAIKDYTGGKNPAVAALLAGNDLIMTPDMEDGVKAVKAALEAGELTIEKIEESVYRVLLLKYRAGLFE